MLGFLKKPTKTVMFDRKVLRKNDISILILDERYNSMFSSVPKTPQIAASEEKLKELLKEEARLHAEAKEIACLKKKYMDTIIRLTPEVFEHCNDEAKKEMQLCEKEIKRINERMAKIEQELEEIPTLIRQANLDLLELVVNVVYFKIRSGQKRVEELEKLIEETKNRLKEYIDEKEALSQENTDAYSYFHDLLGAEELQRLDSEFFKD